MLSTNGDTHLGGDNVDEVLIRWMLEEFKDTGIDATKDGAAALKSQPAANRLSGTSRLKSMFRISFWTIEVLTTWFEVWSDQKMITPS